MKFKQLGNTEVRIPEIGIGTWKYTGGAEPLRQGAQLGATLIDTAEVYGTEEIVGEAIRGRRENVFLATKVAAEHLHYDEVVRAADRSLQRLGTDYVDLYQIHRPNKDIPVGETMRAMETLADEGKIKYIGVSNFSKNELQEAQASLKKYPLVSNQVLYNLNCRDIELSLMPYCERHQVTVIAYTPLDEGRLAHVSEGEQDYRLRQLQQIAQEVQKSPAQVALNWLTLHPAVVAIPKTDKGAHVAENCQASGWRLPPDKVRLLNEMFFG